MEFYEGKKNGPTNDGKERTQNSKKDFVCVVVEKKGEVYQIRRLLGTSMTPSTGFGQGPLLVQPIQIQSTLLLSLNARIISHSFCSSCIRAG